MWLSAMIFTLSVSPVIVYGNQERSCQRTQIFPVDAEYYVLLHNNLACSDYLESRAFCEDSGWGNEEATVVCRNEMKSKYGFGAYANVVSNRKVGFSHVDCTGEEKRLEECSIGNLTSNVCAKAGIFHCFNDSQVLISVGELVYASEKETVDFCVILWTPQPQHVHVLVSTTESGYALGLPTESTILRNIINDHILREHNVCHI